MQKIIEIEQHFTIFYQFFTHAKILLPTYSSVGFTNYNIAFFLGKKIPVLNLSHSLTDT